MERNSRFDDFEKLQFLGKGGYGSVIKVLNRLDNQEYAIKQIAVEGFPENGDSILREVHSMSSMHHSNIVRYYQAWVGANWPFDNDGDCSDSPLFGNTLEISTSPHTIDSNKLYLYIQMEFCPRSLSDFLKYESLDCNRSWTIFHQILQGLIYIHKQQIIHRDLKPENIFLDKMGNAKIGDFGLAKCLGERASSPKTIGTELYMPPNFHEGGFDIDSYALGVIFLELWYPLQADHERYMVLGSLKEMELPYEWCKDFPNHALFLQRLLSYGRPCAVDVPQLMIDIFGSDHPVLLDPSSMERRAVDAEKKAADAERRAVVAERRAEKFQKVVEEFQKMAEDFQKKADESQKMADESQKMADESQKMAEEFQKRAVNFQKRAVEVSRRAEELIS